jgi:DNA-binding GntR family transcriptional regulator
MSQIVYGYNKIVMFQSKRDIAYRILREKILTGKLPPGVRLAINELSADFGMSAGPIQEALLMLQADSLVTIEANEEARVTRIQADKIQEVFETLTALQVISSRAACRHMGEGDFVKLEELLQCMGEAVDNPEQWSAYQLELHQFLCEKAQMQLVKLLLLRVMDHWYLLRRYVLDEAFTGRMSTAQQEQRALVTALRSRNPDTVTQVIQQHHQQALADYLAYLNGASTQAKLSTLVI